MSRAVLLRRAQEQQAEAAANAQARAMRAINMQRHAAATQNGVKAKLPSTSVQTEAQDALEHALQILDDAYTPTRFIRAPRTLAWHTAGKQPLRRAKR